MIILGTINKEVSDIALQWRNNENINKYFRQCGFIHEGQQDKWYEKMCSDNTIRMFSINIGSDPVGICGLTSIDLINRKAELSCYTYDWNRTVESVAITKVLSFGFESLGLHRIWAETFETHKMHLELLPELGFKEEGRLKHSYFKNGQFIDSIIHAKFNQ